ncbi:MAG: hypothetical protein KC912_07655 [Proteobacteria bacterium]|nr:hypothetical protein [Pseudomonadota bacterium]
MNRRRFLGTSLAALLLPAFASGFDGDVTRLSNVSAVFQAAVASGRKMLVFVIPEDNGEKYLRGRALGEFLNHGPEATLARLGEAELVAATMSDLRTLVPSAPKGEPLMVLVDPSKVPSRALALQTPLIQPKYDHDWSRQGPDPEEASIDARIAAIATLIDNALPAASNPLRAGARLRDAVKESIPGSRWSVQGGCGSYIEGEADRMAMGCGMGHVQARSVRVLYFFEV